MASELFLYDNQQADSADVTLRGAIAAVTAVKVGRRRDVRRPGPTLAQLPIAGRPVSVGLTLEVSAEVAVHAPVRASARVAVSVPPVRPVLVAASVAASCVPSVRVPVPVPLVVGSRRGLDPAVLAAAHLILLRRKAAL